MFYRLEQTYNAVIFDLSHLMAHINSFLKFCGTHKIYFLADLTKNRNNFDSFTADSDYVGCCHFFLI